jgi:hypothetical protein
VEGGGWLGAEPDGRKRQKWEGTTPHRKEVVVEGEGRCRSAEGAMSPTRMREGGLGTEGRRKYGLLGWVPLISFYKKGGGNGIFE